MTNYAELLRPAYAYYFFDTLRFGLIVSLLALGLGAPLAWIAARTARRLLRRGIVGLLIGLLFTNLVARLYAILVTYGTTGTARRDRQAVRRHRREAPASPPSWSGSACCISCCRPPRWTLIGTFQNLNPRLEEAAASLGAPRWRIALGILAPLAAPGLISAFLITLRCASAISSCRCCSGAGVVLFTTNLMYVRITEIADYPSGAAIGIIMLGLAFAVVYGLSALARRLLPSEAAA